MYSIEWVFPYELSKEEIFQNNFKHTYNNLKEWIKEKGYLEASNSILQYLKFDSQIAHQKEISRGHEQKMSEIEQKLNEGISPYKWEILKDTDFWIFENHVKADYILMLDKPGHVLYAK